MRNTFVLCLLLASATLLAQPGALDTTFGIGGKVIATLGNDFEVHNAFCALQSDGKIVVAGTVDTAYNKRPFAMRFNEDGTRDYTFANGGVITKATAAQRDTVFAMALQSDGKIVLAGTSWSGINGRIMVLRYNTDGTPDNTFGTSGVKILAINTVCGANAIAIQSDQKILLAGYTISNNRENFLLVRLNTNGNTDNTFGTSGRATTSLGTLNDRAFAVTIQPSDQKILVGGYTVYQDNGFLGQERQYGLVRYSTSGVLDGLFGNAGIVKHKVGGVQGYDVIKALAVTSTQRILAGGTCQSFSSPNRDFAVVAYHTEGKIDSTFADNGKAITDFGNHTDDFYGMALHSNDKFVAAGASFKNDGLTRNFALAAYAEDGNPDVYFGTIGRITTAIGQFNDYPYSVAIQPDGKILLAGSTDYQANVLVGMARYLVTDLPNNIFTPTNVAAVSVFPNPAKNRLNIQLQGAAGAFQYSIFDSYGRIVTKQQAEGNKAMLDISGLPKGMYVAVVESNGHTHLNKFVVQ